MSKIGRNDLCSCGSGKKFKKCCEEKGKTKKLNPERISLQQPPLASEKVSSLFQRARNPISEDKSSDSS